METKMTNSMLEEKISKALPREIDSCGRKYMQEAYKMFCKGEKLSSPILVETYNKAVSYFLESENLYDAYESEKKE